ncbi:MAG: O-antigen ligase family protein [Chloroflexi bacterium]|nr:O-antigen ligase family protein [Chloroflexota bacterium]
MSQIAFPHSINMQNPMQKAFGILSISVLLTSLIILPVASAFSRLEVGSFAGMNINVRFLLLLISSLNAFAVVLLSYTGHLPKILLGFIGFVLIGFLVAVINQLPVRWWFPSSLRWMTAIFFCLGSLQFNSSRIPHPHLFAKAVVVALIIPMGYGLLQIALGLAPFMNGAYRTTGTLNQSPLGFALFLSGISLFLLSNQRIGFVRFSVFVLAFLLIITTHSRLVVIATILALVLLVWQQNRRFMMLGFLVLLFSFTLISPVVIDQLVGRFLVLFTIDNNILQQAPVYATRYQWTIQGVDNSTLLRIQTHFIGWRAWLEAPFWGHGLGSFVPIYEMATKRPDIAAHNDYLLYLVETGVFGLLLYVYLQLALLDTLLRKSKLKNYPEYFFVTATGISYLTINVFSFLSNAYYFFEVQLWIWAAIGLSLGLINNYKRLLLNQVDAKL